VIGSEVRENRTRDYSLAGRYGTPKAALRTVALGKIRNVFWRIALRVAGNWALVATLAQYTCQYLHLTSKDHAHHIITVHLMIRIYTARYLLRCIQHNNLVVSCALCVIIHTRNIMANRILAVT